MASYDCMRRRYVWTQGVVDEIKCVAEGIWCAAEDFYFPFRVSSVCESLSQLLSKYLTHIEFGDYDSDYDDEGNLIKEKEPPCPQPYVFDVLSVYPIMPRYAGEFKWALFRLDYLLALLDESIPWIGDEVMNGYMDEPVGRSVLYALAGIRRAVNEQAGYIRWGLVE